MGCSERKFVPLLVMSALVLDIISMCSRNWLNGYYGDVVVMTLSPWRLCHINCLRCMHEKPTMGCFWIHSWSDTGFETFDIVSHLEYWCLGFLILALLVSLVDWGHSYIRRLIDCPVELSKFTLLILIVGSLLSTLSVALFGAKLHHKTTEITTYTNTKLFFSWPYIVRIAGAFLTWSATLASICHLCGSTTQTSNIENENILIVTSEQEIDQDSLDEAENGALL